MLKNVNSQIGQGSQNEKIESLRSEKKEIQKFFNENPVLYWPSHYNFEIRQSTSLKVYQLFTKHFRKMKTPNISHLTGIAKSFHFNPIKKSKPKYRLFYISHYGSWNVWGCYAVHKDFNSAYCFPDGLTLPQNKSVAHGGISLRELF